MKKSILENARRNFYKPYDIKHFVPAFWYKPFYIITYETDHIHVVRNLSDAAVISKDLNELYNSAILLEDEENTKHSNFMHGATTPTIIKHSSVYGISLKRIRKGLFKSTYQINVKNSVITSCI